MARLRQYNANRYHSSEAVQSEFENVVRYLNSAELGNHTLKELLQKLYTNDGDVNLDIEFRYDAVKGVEVSVAGGEYVTVVPAADLRGAPGVSLGFIDGPVYFNRLDTTATANQQTFAYTVVAEAADVLVFRNGLLEASNNYTFSAVTNQVTMASPQPVNTKLTFYSIRNNSTSTYRRTDFSAGASQVLFPFPHTADEYVQLYRNGILQREGASFDYIKSADTGTITMTSAQPANTILSALVVQNKAVRDVLGLMLEDRYTQNGMLRYDRIAISDDQIPTAKVNGLVQTLALKMDGYIGPAIPEGVVQSPSIWVNTAPAVPRLLFYDGQRWLDPSPEGLLPVPDQDDALRFLRLNSTASAFELVTLDFSDLLPKLDRGAPGGVAALDQSGLVPNSQVSLIHRRAAFSGRVEGSVVNATRKVGVIGGQRYQFDGASYVLDAGTATVQLRIGGVDFGVAIAVGTTPVRQPWPGIVADAAATGLAIELVITAATGATGLSWNVQGTIVS